MNVVTHALFGWAFASVAPGLSRREKSWLVGAAVAPDLDGLGIVAELATRSSASPLLWWSQYHHLLAHNLLFAVLLSLLAATATRRALVAGLVFLSVHLHFLCDLVGSRGPDGYQWPLHYLWPLREWPALVLGWQWRLNAWPNIAISVVLLSYVFWAARRTGDSPLSLVSVRMNEHFVAALRRRFPLHRSRRQHP